MIKKAPWTTTPGGLKPHGHTQPGPKAWKQIRPVSKRKAKRSRAYVKRAAAFVEEAIERGMTCIVVATIAELRNGWKYGHPISARLNEVHHKRGRVGTLEMDERHWMAVSKQGHRWIHAHIAEAMKHGWICEAGLWNVPDTTPTINYDRQT